MQWNDPGAMPPRRRSRLAVVSLVTGLLGILVVSIPAGIIALARFWKTGKTGKGFAIGGLVVSGLWVAGVAAVLVVLVLRLPERDDAGNITKSGETAAVDLRTGDCFSRASDSELVGSVRVMKCSEPHQSQVLSVSKAEGDTFPGDAAMVRTTRDSCSKKWRPALGQSRYAKTHELSYQRPTNRSWSFGDRAMVCVIDSTRGLTRTKVDLSGVKIDPAKKAWAQLKKGDCLQVPKGESELVQTVPCGKPHDAQFLRSIVLPAGPWPGEKAIDKTSDAKCERVFTPWYRKLPSSIEIGYIYATPTEANWEVDRTVACMVSAMSGKLSRSLIPR